MKHTQFNKKVCVMCNEEAMKFDMIQTWTIQSGPRKSRMADHANGLDEAAVSNFDDDIDMHSVCIGIGWRMTNAMMKVWKWKWFFV